MIDELHFLIISLIISIFHLDTLVVGQFMFHRPIVVGPIIGFLIGIPQYGILIGCIFEIICLSLIPIGIKIPPDVTASTICSIISYKLSNGCIVLSLVIGIIIGIIYKQIDLLARSLNSMVINWVDNAKEDVIITRINLLVIYGVVSTYLRSLLFYLIIFPLLSFVIKNIDKINIGVIENFDLVYVLPAIGIGIGLAHFAEK